MLPSFPSDEVQLPRAIPALQWDVSLQLDAADVIVCCPIDFTTHRELRCMVMEPALGPSSGGTVVTADVEDLWPQVFCRLRLL